MIWPFDPLSPLFYQVIMADPPWSFDARSAGGDGKGAKAHYACMATADICALPVDQLARGDAWLFLWATFPMLSQAFEVLRAWRFSYVTGGVWIKRGESGRLAMGTGYTLRGNAEPFLIGRLGRPATLSRSVLNVIEAPRRQHSRKPDSAYRLCERLFGPAYRADLFARQARPGWDGWGFEADKFAASEVAA